MIFLKLTEVMDSICSQITFLDLFLIKGFSFASLQALGNKPEETDKFHKRLIVGTARTFEPSFKNPPENLSTLST